MTENPIVEWLTDINTCFLIGAGCSVCAEKPLMKDLTSSVLEKLSGPAKSLFNNLEGPAERSATIEDLLSQLLLLKRLLSSRKEKKLGDWDTGSAESAIKKSLQSVVEEIGDKWDTSSVHERFFRRLVGFSGRRACDIFSLNYDVVIEATLEKLRLPYTDGFRGAENAYFDLSLFDETSNQMPFFKLYKLHGSINWVRDSDGVIRRRSLSSEDLGERHVIYPSEQKYFQTQYGVYELLIKKLRDRLREERSNNKLVIIGYSLTDEHIIEAIVDAVCTERSNLTVYAFVGPEDSLEKQVSRMQALADRCQNRFNVMIGQEKFIGPALEKTEWDELKVKDLWKFENMVGLLAGETA